MNEDLPGQQLENQIELQKNRESWQIFDSNWPEQLPYMPAAHGGACYYEDYASEDEGPKNNTTYRNYKSPYQLEAAVADGRAVKADTLEELVAKIYPDDTAAQQTALDSIQRYNELAKAGYDEDFHKPASRMWAVENGPFYADKFTTALLLVCIGGLESDEDSRPVRRRQHPGQPLCHRVPHRPEGRQPLHGHVLRLRRRQERPEGHLSLKSQNNFQSPEQKMPAPGFLCDLLTEKRRSLGYTVSVR
ncbi:MAG: hypothetical protein BHW26_01190 [Faecalibacterium prausnitzii]|nr:MAG: hypothetical protein BHW26_01190 [Faecalibacterium prausnitzii]